DGGGRRGRLGRDAAGGAQAERGQRARSRERMASVSIIICTRDRAAHLRQTLESIARVRIPDGWQLELIVVDNASVDETAQVIRECRMPGMPVRYLHEPRRGKGHALNTGIAAARGEILLLTDDDVRPGRDWIGAMCEPILAGKADAVGG